MQTFEKRKACCLAGGADADGVKSFVWKVFADCGIAADREWPRLGTRAVRGNFIIVLDHSDGSVVVPAEEGDSVVGSSKMLPDGKMELAPFGVAVFRWSFMKELAVTRRFADGGMELRCSRRPERIPMLTIRP